MSEPRESRRVKRIRYGEVRQLDQGIQCKECGCRDTRVMRTRRTGSRVTRTRVCRHCGFTFHTYEFGD